MANINPSGIDLITGQNRQITSSDTITDSAGSPIGVTSAKPNVTNWGANTETLSADKTLVSGDATVQYLDPDGVSRTVNLPTQTAAVEFFLIHNNGQGTLSIADPLGAIITSITVNQSAWCINDDVDWVIHTLTSVSRQLDSFLAVFGGDAGGTSTFYKSQGDTTIPTIGGNNLALDYTVPKACTMEVLAYIGQTTTTTTDIIVRKNDVTSESLVNLPFTSAATLTKDLNGTAYAAGDYAGIGYITGSDPNDAIFHVLFDRTESGGYHYRWGGDANASVLFDVYGEATRAGLSGTFSQDNQFTVPEAFTTGDLFYTAELNDATTVFRIHKNLGNDEDVTLTANNHDTITTVGVTCAVNDELSVSAQSGTSPGQTTMGIEAGTLSGMWHGFAGNPASLNAYLNSWGNTSTSATGTSLSQANEQTVAHASSLKFWSINTASLAGSLTIVKNGATSENITPGSAVDSGALNGTSYAKGDGIAVRASSTSLGATNFNILLDL
jgi:hypothetical protein